MQPKCRQRVAQRAEELGREGLTDAEVNAIEARLSATMRRLARVEPEWRSMTNDMRVSLAAEQAISDIRAEAALKLRRAELQALKTAETESRITRFMEMFGLSRRDGLREDMERARADIEGVKRTYAADLGELIESASSGQGATFGRKALMFLFDAQNPAMTRDLALEVFSKGKAGTGNALAKAGAEAWLKVSDAMRKRFNDAGGDVGQLAYGYLPTAHDHVAILRKGADQWANDTMPLLNRDYYLREDGTRMDDAEVMGVLRQAWETITTEGANKREPGQFRGNGARASRGSHERVIHFKDGEAYLAYHQQFGSGSMYDAMIGHIGALSRDIGLLERYGPNTEAQMRLQFDLAKDNTRTGAVQKIADDWAGPEAMWNVLSGKSGMPEGPRLAMFGQHLRNVQVFAKLGGAVLSSITDIGTFAVTVGANRLPYLQALVNVGKANTKTARSFLDSQGYIAESLISDLNRFSGDHLSSNWSGNLAQATMRLSLMNFWTDSLRRAYQLTHAQAIARLQSKSWDKLGKGDRFRLERAGFTADDWAVIQKV